MNIHLILILGLILIALYMFAAIKFPALRFIFMLRSGAASLAGVDDEQNQQLGKAIGLVLCPLIGMICLGAAVKVGFDWKDSVDSQARNEQYEIEKAGKYREDWCQIFNEWEIEAVYFSRARQFGVTEQGMAQAQAFWEKLREHADDVEFESRNKNRRGFDELMRCQLVRLNGVASQLQLVIDPDDRRVTVVVAHHPSGNSAVPLEYEVILPEHFSEDITTLQGLDRVDIEAAEREARRLAAEEHRRLVVYQEKVLAGPASWDIYNAVQSVPENERDAVASQFIDATIEWECEVRSIDRSSDQVVVFGAQSPPANSSTGPRLMTLRLELDPAQAEGLPQNTQDLFVVVRGTIYQVDEHSLRVDVESIEQFMP